MPLMRGSELTDNETLPYLFQTVTQGRRKSLEIQRNGLIPE